jgi:precorrin-8X/cobalt-precorrin-8 methylmutase
MAAQDYIRDGDAIYERSFAIIRAEADLARFSVEAEDVAVRMIHACGLVEAARHFEFSPDFVTAAEAALKPAARRSSAMPKWWRDGVTQARLPARNEVVCTLRDPAHSATRPRD